MVCNRFIFFGKNEQLVRPLLTRNNHINQDGESHNLNNTVYHIGKGLVRKEEDERNNDEVQNDKGRAE